MERRTHVTRVADHQPVPLHWHFAGSEEPLLQHARRSCILVATGSRCVVGSSVCHWVTYLIGLFTTAGDAGPVDHVWCASWSATKVGGLGMIPFADGRDFSVFCWKVGL